MARKTKQITPLFGTNTQGQVTKKDETPPPVKEHETKVDDEKEETTVENQQEEEYTSDTIKSVDENIETLNRLMDEIDQEDDYIQRFKKAKLKMETHIAFNTRIPKTLRKRIDAVEKYYTGGRKNTGFLQEFTANALRAELEKAEKQMEEEKKKMKAKNKKS